MSGHDEWKGWFNVNGIRSNIRYPDLTTVPQTSISGEVQVTVGANMRKELSLIGMASLIVSPIGGRSSSQNEKGRRV
jgi:hypothetical protein